jgi:hypothetical protein
MTRYRPAGYTLRTHLYEFDHGVAVYEMWVISKKLMNRHGRRPKCSNHMHDFRRGLVSVMLSSETCLHKTSNSRFGPLQSCE